jgi:hypothetical protein
MKAMKAMKAKKAPKAMKAMKTNKPVLMCLTCHCCQRLYCERAGKYHFKETCCRWCGQAFFAIIE